MFSQKSRNSSSSQPSSISTDRTSSTTRPSKSRTSSSTAPSQRSSTSKTSTAKRITRGLAILIPSSDKEVKRKLKVVSSPQMGSCSENKFDYYPPYPLHPSVKDKLDPTYVEFYNKHLIDKQQVHLQAVAASRKSGVLIPGGGPELKVGRKEDIVVKRRETKGPDIKCRVFIPEGEPPKEGWRSEQEGWPLMVYYHGGGWVLGNLDTENTVCSQLCVRSRCVVVSVDYRLAPENPYPAAVYDSWEALTYMITTGSAQFNINPNHIAIGGSSAGGNLAAVMTHKLITYNYEHPEYPLPLLKAQLLIVPVTDNTASIWNNNSWRENEFTPALPAAKMEWYRNHYIPEERKRGECEASPLFYSDNAYGVKDRWNKLPRALVVVGEVDVLREEGIAYANRLSKHDVGVELKVMKGMPHPFLAMDGVLQQGQDTISYMVQTLNEVFGKREEEK